MKKPLALLFACDNKMVFSLGVVLLSLKKNSPKLFKKAEIFVFSNDINEQNKKTLLKISPLQILPYKPDIDIKKIPSLTKYTELTLARYEAFEMLKNYSQILWLDTDVLVLKELEGALMSKGDICLALDNNIVASNFSVLPTGYNLSAPNRNAGVFILKDSLSNPSELRNWCYLNTEKMAKALNWPDQGVLNLLIQSFSLKIGNIPPQYNNHPFFGPLPIKRSVLLHAMGKNKFWNNFKMKEWENFYNNWLFLGGSPKTGGATSTRIKFCFIIKGLIEKSSVLWYLFLKTIQLKFAILNKKAIRKEKK